MNTIPEILVKEHLQAIVSHAPIVLKERAAAITLSHIGAALEYIDREGWTQLGEKGVWYNLEYEATTHELLTKYFESLK